MVSAPCCRVTVIGTMNESSDPSVVQATFAATLADEWVRAGVTDAVVSPGSRSTPLALAPGTPAVVCVTSGTAAAELHPAVVEAHHARVPLLVCTADRPPELHGVGAPQTIEQDGLFGEATRWAASPGVPDARASGAWRSLAARAVAEARDGPKGPGPVHLDLAFREPLVAVSGPLPPGRPAAAPWHRAVGHAAAAEIAPWRHGRGVIVAGARAGAPEAVLALSDHLGWPVLADPLSGCRVCHPNVVAAADAIARVSPHALRPDVVVRLGTPWVSKALPALLAGAEVIAVDPWWRWEDPGREAAVVHRCDPGSFIDAACKLPAPDTPGGWLEGWQSAERAAQAAVDAALGGELNEPLVARRLLGSVSGTVLVSSSMPLRDLEWFAPALPSPPRVVANRGANGIDGVVSTGLGLAASGRGPVVSLMGDLAFFHDVGALVAADALRAPYAVVVVDNGGGGIFEFLAQADVLERALFERLFGTPQTPDVLDVARGFGVPAADVGTPRDLEDALRSALDACGLTVVRVRVPQRPANVAVHERVHAEVRRALGVAG